MSDITANVVVSMPSQLFTMARSFKAVANGKIYIGKIDTDPVNPENQIQVYVENEDGSHVPVSQPIIINAAGYPVYNGQIAKFVTVQGHSMAVYDAYGSQQFYFPNVLKYDPDQFGPKLLEDLASDTGSSLIGYPYGTTPAPKSDKTTVEGALNRLNERVVYAYLYGVKADGVTDDTTALKNLSRAVSAMTNPVVRVVFPQGTSLVGAQDQAPNATSGYSFRPSYIATEGNQGWFYVSGRAGKTIIDAYGYTIKLNPGMKHGAFDPATGNAYSSPTTGFKDVNYQAWAGMLATFKGNEDILVLGLHCDGNATNALWGGNWGDSGWQCMSFGIWNTGNKSFEMKHVWSYDCLTDSIYESTESGWNPPWLGQQRTSRYHRCLFFNSRRNGITIAGGQNIVFDQVQSFSIGRKANGAVTRYSAPESCIDIETESGPVYDIVSNNCQFIDGRYTAVAASFINPFSRATFNRCTFRSNSDIAQIYFTGSGIKLNSCLIEGSGMEFRNASQTEVSIKGCVIRNHINGVVSDFCSYAGNIGVCEDNYFDIKFDSKMGSRQVFSISAGDLSVTPPYPQKGKFNFNRINLSGDQDSVTISANGRTYLGYIQFFFDMDFRITASDLSGTRLVDINTAGSYVNQRGITCDTNKVVDRDSGISTIMPSGGYMINRTMKITANVMSPVVSGAQVGSDSARWGDIFMDSAGINIKSQDGTKYRVTVSNSGVLTVNPQP